MVNYYSEFGISEDYSLEEIQKHLVKERKKWSLRLNAADLDKRQKAEQKLSLLDEAVKIFSDEHSRKNYDSELNKEEKTTQQNQQEEAPQVSFATFEAVHMQIENIYETGNSQATVDLCNQAITMGMGSTMVYRYLIDSYGEMEKYDQAIATAKTAMTIYPDDIEIKFSLARLYTFLGQNLDEARNLLNEILQKNPEARGALIALTEIDLQTGNIQKAEKDIAEHIKEYPEDTRYKALMASAYLGYSDSLFRTASNGGTYLDSKEDYEQCLEMRRRAYELNPTEKIKTVFENTKKYGNKKFDTNLLGGILAAIILGVFFSASRVIMIALWALSLWMIISAIEPKWEIDRSNVTGERKLANSIAYVLTSIVKVVWGIIWGIIGGFFGAV